MEIVRWWDGRLWDDKMVDHEMVDCEMKNIKNKYLSHTINHLIVSHYLTCDGERDEMDGRWWSILYFPISSSSSDDGEITWDGRLLIFFFLLLIFLKIFCSKKSCLKVDDDLFKILFSFDDDDRLWDGDGGRWLWEDDDKRLWLWDKNGDEIFLISQKWTNPKIEEMGW